MDEVDGLAFSSPFPSDEDQRHTVNAVGSFRLSGTLALGAQWRHGRLDLRLRKAFLLRWGVFTLSGEVLNVLNRKNEYNVESTLLTVARTGQYTSGLRKGFPVAPSVGLSVQF